MVLHVDYSKFSFENDPSAVSIEAILVCTARILFNGTYLELHYYFCHTNLLLFVDFSYK